MARGVAERRMEWPIVSHTHYSGKGKLLFFGEHAAVYGFPAVGVTLPMGIRVSLHGNHGAEGHRLRGVSPEYRTKFHELLDATRDILRSPKVFDGVDILVESDLPPGRGLGSSASLCVALVAAGVHKSAPALKAGSDTLWSYAHQAERLFHGKPSGIDTGLASGSGIAALYPRSSLLPERRPLSPAPFWMVVGTVPRSGNSLALIQAIGKRYADGRKATIDTIRELGRISERAIAAFSLSSSSLSLMDALAPLADAAQERLASLGLSTPDLEEVLAAGRRAGGVVGKLSGAGSGGAFYFLAGDPETAAKIHAAIAEVFRRRRDDKSTLFRPFFWTGTELEAEVLVKGTFDWNHSSA